MLAIENSTYSKIGCKIKVRSPCRFTAQFVRKSRKSTFHSGTAGFTPAHIAIYLIHISFWFRNLTPRHILLDSCKECLHVMKSCNQWCVVLSYGDSKMFLQKICGPLILAPCVHVPAGHNSYYIYVFLNISLRSTNCISFQYF